MEEIRSLIIPLLIGALVGLERQKAHPGENLTLGLRSFILLGLLGALTSWFESLWMEILMTGFSLSLILLSYWATAKRNLRDGDLGLTTEIAAAVVFFLAYASRTMPMLSALLGCLLALVLFAKRPLHSMSDRIKPSELQAGIILSLLGIGVVSFLPDTYVDPWQIFNPKKFGMIVFVLGLIEFAGYVGVKLLGRRKGSLLTGFMGGLVSSTAIMLIAARASRKTPKSWKAQVGIVTASQAASILQALVIIALVSMPLAMGFSATAASALAVVLISLVWYQRSADANIELDSPLDLKNILKLALVLALILGAVNAAESFLGQSGVRVITFLSGFFELHGISYANANAFSEGRLEQQAALQLILLALLASFLAKIGLAWTFGDRKFAISISLVLLLTGAVSSVAFWLI